MYRLIYEHLFEKSCDACVTEGFVHHQNVFVIEFEIGTHNVVSNKWPTGTI